jgi:hypothetical protein
VSVAANRSMPAPDWTCCLSVDSNHLIPKKALLSHTLRFIEETEIAQATPLGYPIHLN